jgi:hypothetical protein
MDFLVAPVARALGAVRWAAVEPEAEAGVLTGRLRREAARREWRVLDFAAPGERGEPAAGVGPPT